MAALDYCAVCIQVLPRNQIEEALNSISPEEYIKGYDVHKAVTTVKGTAVCVKHAVEFR